MNRMRRTHNRRAGLDPRKYAAMRLAAVSMVFVLTGCQCGASAPEPSPSSSAKPSWHVNAKKPVSHPKMVWIPAGTLIAGTPAGHLPRMVDREMPGVSVKLGGFFIDRFNYPDEPGSLPTTGLSFEQAKAVCEKQNKRLCTELEWERACKGPDNVTYEYGDSYDPSACGTGPTDAIAPNGIHDRCTSGFGVRDLHGSAANWTASAWGRGSKRRARSVRGGTGTDGELVGRCAYARAVEDTQRAEGVGVRCCAGELNQAEVELEVEHGEVLLWLGERTDQTAGFRALLPKEVRDAIRSQPLSLPFQVTRHWSWRPVPNERLFVAGGCGKVPRNDVCGVMIARRQEGRLRLLLFVSSDWWQPSVAKAGSSRVLRLYGGDRNGAFRKPIYYRWGRIVEGAKQRKRGGDYVRIP